MIKSVLSEVKVVNSENLLPGKKGLTLKVNSSKIKQSNTVDKSPFVSKTIRLKVTPSDPELIQKQYYELRDGLSQLSHEVHDMSLEGNSKTMRGGNAVPLGTTPFERKELEKKVNLKRIA